MTKTIFSLPLALCLVLWGLAQPFLGCDLDIPGSHNAVSPVSLPIGVTSIAVTPSTARLGLTHSTSLQLSTSIEPASATNRNVTWASSDLSRATVTSTGFVTAGSAPGDVTITATTTDGGFSATCSVTVGDLSATGVAFSGSSLSLVKGGSSSLQTPVFSPPQATNTSGQWNSTNPSVVSVDSGFLSPVGVGSATVTFTADDGAFVATLPVTVTASTMLVGTNLWNVNWQAWQNHYIYFRSGVTNWATETNPWNPAFLADLAPFTGPIRMMDWDNANWSPIIHWTDRIPKSWNHYLGSTNQHFASNPFTKSPTDGGYPIAIAPELKSYFPDAAYAGSWSRQFGVAYEWQIDLCNRLDKDLWINVPIAADDDYMKRLAALVNASLKPGLKCYVEYGNENWNNGWRQTYMTDHGAALGLPGINNTPTNKWYQGESFNAFRSLQMFKIFQDEFGAGNTGWGKRLIRILSTGGNRDLGYEAVKNVIFDGVTRASYTPLNYNQTLNPHAMVPDVYCVAPYVGAGIADGSAPDILTTWRSYQTKQTADEQNFVNVWKKFHIPIGAYEGGQHLYTKGVDAWSRNPLIYGEYKTMLDHWKELGFVFFLQYSLYSNYSGSSAWGAKEFPSDLNTTAVSPKYAALVDWIGANP